MILNKNEYAKCDFLSYYFQKYFFEYSFYKYSLLTIIKYLLQPFNILVVYYFVMEFLLEANKHKLFFKKLKILKFTNIHYVAHTF